MLLPLFVNESKKATQKNVPYLKYVICRQVTTMFQTESSANTYFKLFLLLLISKIVSLFK